MHPVVINDPEDGIAGGAPDPAAPLLVDEPEQPEQPAAADDDADGDDAANNADEDNDDEVGRVVLPVDDRRARNHWPMEGNVTDASTLSSNKNSSKEHVRCASSCLASYYLFNLSQLR